MAWPVAVREALKRLGDDRRQLRVQGLRGRHPVHQPDRERGVRGDVVVQQRELLGAAQTDQSGQPQDRAVGDEPVLGGAEPDDGVARGQPHVAGHRELQPAADGVAVQHRHRELVHVLEAVQRANPVPVEGLAHLPRRQGLPVHARGERAARPAHHHHPHRVIARGRLGGVRERGGEPRSSAFSTAGRFSVMVATPCVTSYRMGASVMRAGGQALSGGRARRAR